MTGKGRFKITLAISRMAKSSPRGIEQDDNDVRTLFGSSIAEDVGGNRGRNRPATVIIS